MSQRLFYSTAALMLVAYALGLATQPVVIFLGGFWSGFWCDFAYRNKMQPPPEPHRPNGAERVGNGIAAAIRRLKDSRRWIGESDAFVVSDVQTLVVGGEYYRLTLEPVNNEEEAG